MRLILDEMVPPALAEQLRRRGIATVAVPDLGGLRGASDGDLLTWARGEGRIVITYNRDDFLDLDRQCRGQGREHAGIVIVGRRRFPQGERSIGPLVRALEAFATATPPQGSFVHWLD